MTIFVLRNAKRWMRRNTPEAYVFLAKAKRAIRNTYPDAVLTAGQKQELLRSYAVQTNKRILVETGTYQGDTLFVLYDAFDKLYSIELDDGLYVKAMERFIGHDKVTLLHGDSGVLLPKLLIGISGSVLFWIDAHYAGIGFALGDKDTPIFEELEAIAEHPVKDHCILIDDARSYNGRNDYPTLDRLRARCRMLFPNHSFEVKDDVIRIVPFGGANNANR